METKKVTSAYRMAHWGAVLQARAQSGQSVQEFCASSGISRNRYFYWQRKLREAACEKLLEETELSRDKLVPHGWTQLLPQAIAKTSASVAIEIEGCSLWVTAETDMTLLREICRTLKTL